MIVKGSLSYTVEQWEALDAATSDAHDSAIKAIVCLDKARHSLVKALHNVHALSVNEKLPDHLAAPEMLAMEALLHALTARDIDKAWDAWTEVGYEQ